MLNKSEEEKYRDWLYESEKKIILPAKTIVLLVSFAMLYFLNREFFFSPWCLYFFLFCLLFRPYFIGERIYKRLFYKHYLKVSLASFIWDTLFLVIMICLTGGVRSPLTLVLYAMVIRGAVSYFPSKRLFFSGMATIFLCWIIGLFLIGKNFLFLRKPILLPQMVFFWILSLASTFAITTLAEKKEALQKSEKGFRSIFDTIDDLLFIVDSETKSIREVNQKVLEVLGYTREELCSMTVPDLHPMKRREEAIGILREIIEGRRRFCPIPLLTKKGRLIPVETRVSLGYYEGRPAIIGISRDITERKKAEDEIKNYQKKIKAMINSSRDLIFLKDKDFRYLIANKAHEKFFNIKTKDIIGKTDFDFMPKEAAQGCRKTDKETLKSKGPINKEEFIGDKCFQVVKQKVVDATGKIIGIAAVIHDITELKSSQDRLLRTEKLATVGRLGAGVAHELNNPLGIIFMNIQRLAQKMAEERTGMIGWESYQRAIKRIKEASLRSQRIINSLLSFSRISEPKFSPTNINRVLDEIFSLVEHQVSLENIKIIKKYDPHLPKVLGDPSQIKQVFINLILNAQQAMPQGGKLYITTKKKKNSIEAEVRDTGCGIPKKDIGKIFDPFFSSSKRGTGLGLFVSHGIIEHHHGSIEIKSEKGKGTSVIIHLPLPKGKR